MASLAVLAPASTASATISCSSLMVIGARGSGEPYAAETAGMGEYNYAAYQQIKARVPDAQAFGLAPYSAVAIIPQDGNSNVFNVLADDYWESMSLGAVVLGRLVDQFIAACPNQRIALLGYSQGAHVIDEDLATWGTNENTRNRIAGILTFGDPRFNPTWPFAQGSYSATREGVFSARTVSSVWWGKIRTYCDGRDFVCGWSPQTFANCPPWTSEHCGHFSYGASGAAAAGGVWLGDLAQSLPPLSLPPPPPPPTSPAQMFIRGDSAVFARTGIGTSWTQETSPGNATAIASSSTGIQMFIRGDSAVFARIGIGSTGWVQETSPGNAMAIAAGGDTQLFLRGDHAVFARTGIGDTWVQETAPGTANAIAVSSTGLQTIITSDAAIWSKTGIGYGGWIQEVGPGNANAIAVGGNTRMFIRGDAAVFAKSGALADGGWTQETSPGNANKIAVSDTGVQMFIRGDAAVFARSGIGTSWTQAVGPGNAWAIAVGGNTELFARGDNALFATGCIGCGWMQETSPGNTQAITTG